MTNSLSRRPHRRRRGLRTRAAIAVLLACIGSIVAAGNAFGASSTAVKLGLVLPLSGTSATSGQAADNGAQLAVQQANRGKLVSGVTFSLVAKSDTGARARRMAPPARANGQIAGVAAFLKDYVDRGDLGVKTGRGFYATRSPPTHGPASSSRRTHDVHITGAFEH